MFSIEHVGGSGHWVSHLLLPLRRTVVFVFFAGEERGLLGSGYNAAYPTIKNIAAMINIDMVLMDHALVGVTGLRAEHSSLGQKLEAAAGKFGVQVVPDPMAHMVRFIGSDHYSYVKRGVVSIFVIFGQNMSDTDGDGVPEYAAWMRNRYHSPADDAEQPLLFEEGARFVGIIQELVRSAANDSSVPVWKTGSVFEGLGRK